jgi:hypothetical protein
MCCRPISRPPRRSNCRCHRRCSPAPSTIYPPSAIATPTMTLPSATNERPIDPGRNPAQRPNMNPHRNSIAIATAFDTRSASFASPMSKNGMTMGNVDRKLSRQIPSAPSQSVVVSRGRAGSDNRCNLCRINSSCAGSKTDATSGGNAFATIRCAAATSAAWRTARQLPLHGRVH